MLLPVLLQLAIGAGAYVLRLFTYCKLCIYRTIFMLLCLLFVAQLPGFVIYLIFLYYHHFFLLYFVWSK